MGRAAGGVRQGAQGARRFPGRIDGDHVVVPDHHEPLPTRVLHDFNTGPGSFDWGIDDTSLYVWRATGEIATVAKYSLVDGDGVLPAQFDSASPWVGPNHPPIEGTVAVDEACVYVRTAKDLRRVPKGGGETSIVYAATDDEIIDNTALKTALDDRSVFDMSRGRNLIIASVPKTGGPAVDVGLDTHHWNFPWQMLASDDYLFFRSVDFSQRDANGLPVNGSSGVVLLVPKDPPPAP